MIGVFAPACWKLVNARTSIFTGAALGLAPDPVKVCVKDTGTQAFAMLTILFPLMSQVTYGTSGVEKAGGVYLNPGNVWPVTGGFEVRTLLDNVPAALGVAEALGVDALSVTARSGGAMTS